MYMNMISMERASALDMFMQVLTITFYNNNINGGSFHYTHLTLQFHVMFPNTAYTDVLS